MRDLATRLRDGLSGRYLITREAGRGGMATVFLARDLRHHRPVALKVLHPVIASEVGSERFEREVRLVARLQHPHIVPVLDSGESPDAPGEPDLLWFTMPFVEGESLRDRLHRETQLPVADALRITSEVADALDYAHRQGVVHRDIKPENILLSGNHALVADFGIARAVSSDNEVDIQTITATGTAVGTIAYMSPEQSSGEHRIDARSDQYSLACVLYELLVGEPPFTGPTAQIVITRRFTEDPRSLRATRPGVPVEVERAVSRALSRIPADRYSTVAEFARALQVAVAPQASGAFPTASRSRLRTMATVAATALLLTLGGAVASLWSKRSAPRPDDFLSIAVLPFEYRGDSADAYLAEGVTDDVRGKLANLPRSQVIARASVTQYRGSHQPLTEIAEQLGVRYLLTGTIRWFKVGSEKRVRVSTELVEVTSEGARVKPGGSESFDASLNDVFQVQAVIATRIASALQVVISPATAAAIAAAPTSNIAAYDEFLRGEAAYLGSSGPVSQDRAREHYENAVTLDSSFALAWARLSQINSSRFASSFDTAFVTPARVAAEKALSIDPKLPDAHLAMGNQLTLVQYDYPGAIAAYRSGLALNAMHPELLGAIGLAEQGLGRLDQAIESMQRALALDPRSLFLTRRLTRALTWAHRFPEADAMSRKALALAPADNSALHYAVLLRLAQGDLTGARAITRSIPPEANLPALLAYWSTFYPISGWFLDDEHKQLVLRLPVSAYNNVQRERWQAFMFLSLQRGDSGIARAYADSAMRVIEPLARVDPSPAWKLAMGWLHAVQGHKTEAMREGEQALALKGNDAVSGQQFRHCLIQIYLLVGEQEKALDQLEAFQSIPYYMTPEWIRIDPTLAALRDHPRFRKLVDRGR